MYVLNIWAFVSSKMFSRWFSWGVASLPEGSAFSVVVCKIQARKRYIESLPLVLKDKKAVSLEVKDLLYSCLLIVHLPLQPLDAFGNHQQPIAYII